MKYAFTKSIRLIGSSAILLCVILIGCSNKKKQEPIANPGVQVVHTDSIVHKVTIHCDPTTVKIYNMEKELIGNTPFTIEYRWTKYSYSDNSVKYFDEQQKRWDQRGRRKFFQFIVMQEAQIPRIYSVDWKFDGKDGEFDRTFFLEKEIQMD